MKRPLDKSLKTCDSYPMTISRFNWQRRGPNWYIWVFASSWVAFLTWECPTIWLMVFRISWKKKFIWLSQVQIWNLNCCDINCLLLVVMPRVVWNTITHAVKGLHSCQQPVSHMWLFALCIICCGPSQV